jgi:dTMP kinase
MKSDNRGLFFVIEGNDGAGKTTQINLMSEYLQSKGREVYITREPSDSKYGRKIRELVVSDEGKKLNDEEWLELFTLDRKEHLDYEIKPALEKGKIVLCDRYDYSTCAYQIKDEDRWKTYISQFMRPDLTFIIIVPTKVAMERLYGRGKQITIFEKEKLTEERKERYMKLFSLGENIKKIDGSDDIKGVFKQIKKEIDDFLGYK